MKITPEGLEANWEEIELLVDAYDRGCKSEEAYRAKIFSLIYNMGYDDAVEEMEKKNYQTAFLLSCTMGNA